MPSTNDDSPPEPFNACLAAIRCCAPAIAGAIILTHDLSMHTRPPEGRYPVLVLSFTYGVLPSASATLSFACPKFEWRLVDRRGPERKDMDEHVGALLPAVRSFADNISEAPCNGLCTLQFTDECTVLVIDLPL